MTVITEWQCLSCRNYAAFGICVAFPDGIPRKIWSGQHDHQKPIEGDNGILFEAIDYVEPIKQDSTKTEADITGEL